MIREEPDLIAEGTHEMTGSILAGLFGIAASQLGALPVTLDGTA
jgi:hypothetical protein